MAKTVTQAFTDAWKSRDKATVKRIDYKRRYWNGSAYVYESAWKSLYLKDYINAIGSLSWHLDSVFLNEFRSSTVVLRLKNNRYEWLPGNQTTGIFASDAVATSGYEPYLTQFKIYIGYEKADGTEELLSVFTGVLTDYVMNTETGLAELTVSDLSQHLLAADAQKVSDAFTNEAFAEAADGSRTEFTTASLGVGRVTRVRIAATAKAEGADYTVSNLNVPGEGAKVKFKVAPAVAAAVDSTGIKWKANQKISDLVGLLCDQAGITDREIATVLFPNGVNAFFTMDTQAHWEAVGTTRTHIDTTTFSGSIIKAWTLLNDFSTDDWTVRAAISGASLAVSDGKYRVSMSGTLSRGAADKDLAQNTGTWRFKTTVVSNSAPGGSNNGDGMAVMVFQTAAGTSDAAVTGYGLLFNLNTGGGSANGVQFVRIDNNYTVNKTVLGTVLSSFPAGEQTWTVTRESGGVWNIYQNGTLKLTVTDNTYTTNAKFGAAGMTANSSASITVDIDDVYYTSRIDGQNTTAAVWDSEAKDVGSTPTAWGLLVATQTLNGGTIAYETNVSADNVTYDGWVAAAGNGQILSALKRYLKIRITITPQSGNSTSPQVDKLLANYSTSQPIIALANFTGKTCFAAVQRLAFVCSYEWGFDGTGKFFFRSKAAGAVNFTLNENDGITKVKSLKPGWPEVITDGQVSYGAGNYYREYTPTSLPETQPRSDQRFGTRISFQTITDILFANDTDIASGMAQILHDDNYRPRKRVSLETKMTPQMDLGDVVQVSYFEDSVRRDNLFGDWATEEPAFGEDQAFLMRDLKCRVVGVAYNLERETMDLTLQEVLS